jgi:hypothetical protein
MLIDAASAQLRTLYDASGKVALRAAIDSQGTVTNYDSPGPVDSRRPLHQLRFADMHS